MFVQKMINQNKTPGNTKKLEQRRQYYENMGSLKCFKQLQYYTHIHIQENSANMTIKEVRQKTPFHPNSICAYYKNIKLLIAELLEVALHMGFKMNKTKTNIMANRDDTLKSPILYVYI